MGNYETIHASHVTENEAARIGEMKNVYEILIKKSERKRPPYSGVPERILHWIL
jgi:hypothetical protein